MNRTLKISLLSLLLVFIILNTWSNNTSNVIAHNLKPENTYEARVKGIFSEGSGPWSNIVTFTTPPQVEIQCGQAGVPPSMANFVPLTTGNIGQVWNVGQFDMTVIQLDNPNNPNGRYSGYGKVAIPFLAGMSFTVKFTNIAINEAMQLADGEVEAVSEGMDEWLQGQYEEGVNNESVTEINGTIDTVIIHSNGTIEITNTNGETSTIANAALGTNHNQILNDSAGNSYIITPAGDILFVPASVNAVVKLALQEISSASSNSIATATTNLNTSQQSINQMNNINTIATNVQVADNIIEDAEAVSLSEIQALQAASQKMFTYKQKLLLKSQSLVLKEFTQHYLNKKSYSEVAVYTIVQNKSLKDGLLLKISQNESQENMIIFAKDKISVFVGKLVEDKINTQ